MEIVLYTVSDPKIKVNKTLGTGTTITGEPHDNVTDTEMQVRFTVDQLSTIKASNYCYISETGKYYYISPNYEIENHSVIVHLSEDVLMSLKTQLLAQTCTISRNENLSNAYLYDEGYQLLAYKNIVTKTFPSGINTDSIILMTVG